MHVSDIFNNNWGLFVSPYQYQQTTTTSPSASYASSSQFVNVQRRPIVIPSPPRSSLPEVVLDPILFANTLSEIFLVDASNPPDVYLVHSSAEEVFGGPVSEKWYLMIDTPFADNRQITNLFAHVLMAGTRVASSHQTLDAGILRSEYGLKVNLIGDTWHCQLGPLVTVYLRHTPVDGSKKPGIARVSLVTGHAWYDDLEKDGSQEIPESRPVDPVSSPKAALQQRVSGVIERSLTTTREPDTVSRRCYRAAGKWKHLVEQISLKKQDPSQPICDKLFKLWCKFKNHVPVSNQELRDFYTIITTYSSNTQQVQCVQDTAVKAFESSEWEDGQQDIPSILRTFIVDAIQRGRIRKSMFFFDWAEKHLKPNVFITLVSSLRHLLDDPQRPTDLCQLTELLPIYRMIDCRKTEGIIQSVFQQIFANRESLTEEVVYLHNESQKLGLIPASDFWTHHCGLIKLACDCRLDSCPIDVISGLDQLRTQVNLKSEQEVDGLLSLHMGYLGSLIGEFFRADSRDPSAHLMRLIARLRLLIKQCDQLGDKALQLAHQCCQIALYSVSTVNFLQSTPSCASFVRDYGWNEFFVRCSVFEGSQFVLLTQEECRWIFSIYLKVLNRSGSQKSAPMSETKERQLFEIVQSLLDLEERSVVNRLDRYRGDRRPRACVLRAIKLHARSLSYVKALWHRTPEQRDAFSQRNLRHQPRSSLLTGANHQWD